jgi:type II secretory pathway component PulJ
MNKYKIKAFTLSEVTIAMAIVIIVVIMAYLIRENMQQQYNIFDQNEKNSFGLIETYTRIKKDVDKSELIIGYNNKLSFYLQTGDSIVYSPSDSIILRTDKSGGDTLKATLVGYENLSLNKDMLPIINKILLLFPSKANETITLYKQYAPSEAMKYLKTKK